jgi:hypothetical protein
LPSKRVIFAPGLFIGLNDYNGLEVLYNSFMPDFLVIGRWLAILGVCLVIIGGIVYLIGRIGGFSQFPGTLRLEGQGITCVFPILGSILLSIILTLLLNLAARFWK